MQLDQLRMQARLRNGWQAIDLGWVLARRWWRPLLLSWMVPFAAVLALAMLVLPQRLWWVAGLSAWWLKPLYDAAALYLLSRRLFGEEISPLDAWRGALASLGREALPWLLWRRISPTRSFDMPLSVLEKLRGDNRSRRLSLLHLRSGNAAVWLTLVCLLLEIVIGTGLLGFVAMMLPENTGFSLTDISSGASVWRDLLQYCISVTGAGLVAPFYVAAGFSIYLNRRIELEGWDVEIRFRHIAASAGRMLPALLLAALLGVSWLQSPYACASTPPPSGAVASGSGSGKAVFAREERSARKRIDKVLKSPDFGREKVERHWRFTWQRPNAGQSKVPKWMIRIIELLERVGGFGNSLHGGVVGVVDVLRWLLGAMLVAMVAWLLYHYREALREWLHLPESRPRDTIAPQTLFGLDVRTESLPADVLGEVEALNRRRQFREALSLLYRASLARLLHRFSLPFRDDMTEGECMRLVAEATDVDVSRLFTDLTAAWQRQAYGHVAPTTTVVDDLCQRWRRVFDDAR